MSNDTSEEQSLKRLKSIVTIMGILLVFGTLALFIAVIIKANSAPKEQNSTYNNQKPHKCNYKDTTIPIADQVINATSNNNLLTIITKSHNHIQNIIIFDTCENKILRKYSLTSTE